MPARVAVSLLLFSLLATPTRADIFDRYTNPVLAKAPDGPGVKEIKKLTPELIEQHGRLVPDTAGVLLVVKTNTGLNSKLIVTTARQRAEKGAVPMALIERFVTYKASEDRALQATGQNVHVYGGFQFKLDLGQVVPTEVGGDLRFVTEGEQGYVEPVGAAKMYLITKHLPGTEVKKVTKPTIGEVFEPTFFNGTYKIMDDGRRTAKLTLKVEADGTVGGEYISEASGRAYEVFGKVGEAKHRIQFTVKFPQSEQVFTGYMFTRDGKAICGTSKMQEKEFGFYALRTDEE